MVYRVYISTTEAPDKPPYLLQVQQVLISMNQLPLSRLHISATDAQVRLSQARQMIETADIYVQIISRQHETPATPRKLTAQLEYDYAYQQGLLCLIFAEDGTAESADGTFADFLQRLMQKHIINSFTTATELASQVKIGISKARETRGYQQDDGGGRTPRITLRGGQQNLVDPSTVPPIPQEAPPTSETSAPDAPAEDLDQWVTQALDLAQDEIEQIVRRALELHDAAQTIQAKDRINGLDGIIQARPLWGEPQSRSQFQSDIFMVMPFRDRFDQIYRGIIRPLVADLNLTINRGDDFRTTGNFIMQEVWNAIHAARLIIAETTGDNPNVYYELGIAHTLGKPVILLTQHKDDLQIPFDIRHLRFIVYENSISGGQTLRDDLQRTIIWTLNDLEEQMTDA